MARRRDLLKGLITLPLAGAVGGNHTFARSLAADIPRDYFKELGVRTFINASGTYTILTASLMPPEVMKAINYASLQYVRLEELQEKVGERLAELLQCESGMVTAGAASAITLGTAGVITGGDPKKAAMIPNDLTGMKSEVIIQKSHRVGYDHAIRNCGVTLVEVETRKELEEAINEKTAMMWFYNNQNPIGKIRDEEFVAIGKKHGIPTFNDCAADVPPVENFWKYTQMGFDLVCFSGGKGIRGPQSAGLLLGRKDLITAALRNAPPHGDTVGRGMKVNKEEILGMLVAVELFLKKDHQAEWKLWEDQINMIREAAVSVPGVKGEVHVPEIANHVPALKISWNNQVKATPAEIREALRNGHPSIEVMGGRETLDITTWMMVPGEERIVAKRIKELLEQASKS